MTSTSTPTQLPTAPTATTQPGIPFARLLTVEMRKLFDTRAARIILIIMVAGAIALQTLEIFLGDKDVPAQFTSYLELGMTVVLMLVPVIVILATTAEWSQRTAMTTFMWEPRRSRVLTAKGIAALAVSVVSAVVVLVTAVGTAVMGGAMRPGVEWGLSGSVVLGYVVMLVLLVAQGLAYGALLHNTAAALVAYFMAPMVFTLLTAFIAPLGEVADWVDFNIATSPILAGDFTGDTMQRAAVAVTIWVLVPGVLGVWRTIRREVK